MYFQNYRNFMCRKIDDILAGIEAANFPTSLVAINFGDGKLTVEFPVMRAQHGWRTTEFNDSDSTSQIIDILVAQMSWDAWFHTDSFFDAGELANIDFEPIN